MRRLTLLLAAVVILITQGAAEQTGLESWTVAKISRSDFQRHARPETGGSNGSLKYLLLTVRFAPNTTSRKMHRFRVVDGNGETVGQMFGYNWSKSLLVFERETGWSSLQGLYLDGLGYRVPLFGPRCVRPSPTTGTEWWLPAPPVVKSRRNADLPDADNRSDCDEDSSGKSPGDTTDRPVRVPRLGTSPAAEDGLGIIPSDNKLPGMDPNTDSDPSMESDTGSDPGRESDKRPAPNVAPKTRPGPGPDEGPGRPGTDTLPNPEMWKNFVGPPKTLPEAVLYISVGNEGQEGGKIYQVNDVGRVLGIVTLPYQATGLALHRQDGLIAVTPRDGGKIYRIDGTGRSSVVMENSPKLPHPVDVGMPGESDTIVVADNVANILAATSVTGTDAIVYRRFKDAPNAEQAMSVAVARDRHVLLGTDASEGIYRFTAETEAASRGRMLPGRGGVAADPQSLKWAATQSPDLVHVFEGEMALKTFELGPGKSIYHKGLLSFAPSGAVVVATRHSNEVDEEVWLTAYEIAEGEKGKILSLFPWDRERMLDFVVGPRMLWERHSPSNYKSKY